MSTGDIIVALIIVGLVAMSIALLLKGRKKGVSACGCDCGSCSASCGTSVITDKTISDKKE